MSAIQMPPNQQIRQRRSIKSDLIYQSLSVLYHPAESTTLRSFPLVCIGQNLSVVSKQGEFSISSMFLSPSGDVSIVLKNHISETDLNQLIEHIRTWRYDDLDSTASDYTYLNLGQAYRIIDIMAKHGHLKFSDSSDLVNAVNQNMRDGKVCVLCTDVSI